MFHHGLLTWAPVQQKTRLCAYALLKLMRLKHILQALMYFAGSELLQFDSHLSLPLSYPALGVSLNWSPSLIWRAVPHSFRLCKWINSCTAGYLNLVVFYFPPSCSGDDCICTMSTDSHPQLSWRAFGTYPVRHWGYLFPLCAEENFFDENKPYGGKQALYAENWKGTSSSSRWGSSLKSS